MRLAQRASQRQLNSTVLCVRADLLYPSHMQLRNGPSLLRSYTCWADSFDVDPADPPATAGARPQPALHVYMLGRKPKSHQILNSTGRS